MMRGYLRRLTTGVAIYGAGDAAISVVNFLLLPVYVRVLTPADYGALLVLVSIETFVKIANRWGLDGAFMRYFLDREDGAPRQQMATTILVFLFVLDGLLLAVGLAASRPIGGALFGNDTYLVAFRLMLVNMFLVAFTFVPFHVMRIAGEALQYSALTFARSAGTTILRLVLVVGWSYGVAGLYAADLLVTLALLPVLWRWTRPLVTTAFSWTELRIALRFGLPRLPHGLAQQAFDYGNRLLLTRYVPLAEAGVYQNGATLGTGVKFFLAAFETAWAPFYYSAAKAPDGRVVLAKMTTYVMAVLVLLVAATTAVSADLVLLMLGGEYVKAIPIVPVVAVAFAFQGLYLLTSIGLNLSSQTQYYAVSTFIAAAVGLLTGSLLIPRLGALGAAYAVLASFMTQAVVALILARRLFPIPYESRRLVLVLSSGLVATAVAIVLVPSLPPIAGLFVRSAITVGTYAGLLLVTGFLRPSERAFMKEALAGLVRR